MSRALLPGRLRDLGGVRARVPLPSHPAKNEDVMRRAHALHLPYRERISRLYDATWLGSAKKAFLVTSRRPPCWKNPCAVANSSSGRISNPAPPDQLDADRGGCFIGAYAILIEAEEVRRRVANAFPSLMLSVLPPLAIAARPKSAATPRLPEIADNRPLSPPPPRFRV